MSQKKEGEGLPISRNMYEKSQDMTKVRPRLGPPHTHTTSIVALHPLVPPGWVGGCHEAVALGVWQAIYRVTIKDEDGEKPDDVPGADVNTSAAYK
jgi:hypothetical protein